MVSCLVIAWLILATLTVVVAGVVVVGFTIAFTNALLAFANAIAKLVGLAIAEGVVLFELARGLAIGLLVAGALGWLERIAAP